MLLADEAQGVFARGFDRRQARRRLDALRAATTTAATRSASPPSCTVTSTAAGRSPAPSRSTCAGATPTRPTRRRAVGEEIDRHRGRRATRPADPRRDHDAQRSATGCAPSSGFGSWEERGEHTIVCENVQRMKGLEFDVVVLVADDDVTDLLLYVGMSRAVSGFTLVGPASVAARLGLAGDVDDVRSNLTATVIESE